MSIESPRRIRRSPEAARENILSAAQGLLLDRGPQALKLVDVAKGAGVSHATVLHHFGSIGEVQTALMEQMIRQLVEQILTAERSDDPEGQLESVGQVLFDAFESAGGARLAAWLELTGEARRLTLVREAVGEVISGPMAQKGISPDRATNLVLVAVSLAMGVGLIGRSLAELVGRPPDSTREAAQAFLKAGLAAALQE
ncbi:MAG: TetR/AcrR family transcriptional regulator [Phenylobacterium sp.]|uniref:TetR/AcrR family transcriptional regulator n=1 Tax=Phenylobacterium sp. TaxID=1871053 RepID=UPI00271A4587|nr:TetR/AcrR family transcriptional regulator [Phenylobacterium sp.]MDO8901017.1 TetR/AcrR family transcriptional regulator [Phenylobacterium sp.]